MAIDLITLAKDFLGDAEFGELAKLLGTDKQTAKKAVDGTLPTVVGGYVDKANSPEGARELYRETESQDDSILDDLIGAVSGGGFQDLVSKGGTLLNSVFGSKLTVILPILARITGLDRGITGKLVSFLGPFLLSVLSKQKNADQLDEKGFSNFLASQRPAVADAMPEEIRNELEFSRTAEQKPAPPEKQDNGLPGWLIPVALAGLALIAYLAYTGANTDETAPDPSDRIVDSEEAVDLDSVEGEISQTFARVTEMVGEITDATGAGQAVNSLSEQIKGLSGLDLKALGETELSDLSRRVQPLVIQLRSALETVYRIDGVEAVVRPIMEPLFEFVERLDS